MATIRVQPTSTDHIAISVMETDSRGNPKLVKQILLTPEFAGTRFIESIKAACGAIAQRKRLLEEQKLLAQVQTTVAAAAQAEIDDSDVTLDEEDI